MRIVPIEMQRSFPMQLHDGVWSTTTRVWETLTAARDGNLPGLESLISHCPQLATCQYNYTPPLHLAVLEGRADVVAFLLQAGGMDPAYRTYPFGDSLVTLAEDRGDTALAATLSTVAQSADLARKQPDVGEIDYQRDEDARRFQDLVNHDGGHAEIEGILDRRPELALDETASWSEGILMMPAKVGDRRKVDLLMGRGARVPGVSKWSRFYYFEREDMCAYLLSRGASPRHTSWRRVTALHDMSQAGDARKARLFIDHGADVNAIDDEYRSSPLGFASRWGRAATVELLLEHGADPNASGADWARPLTWARRKGHRLIADRLRAAGATE